MKRPVVIQAPQEVRLRKRENRLEVLWADGLRTSLTCLALRRACACSACLKARQSGALTLIDADVGVARLEVNGVSGLQFHFSDGHYKGLYPWGYLRELSEQLGEALIDQPAAALAAERCA
jgi:DUF971 family protein